MSKDALNSTLLPHGLPNFRWLALSALLAALSLLPIAAVVAQGQPDQDQAAPPAASVPQTTVQPAQQPDQDSRPVISRDTIPQDPSSSGSQSTRRPSPNRRPTQTAPAGTVPPTLTVPAGTVLFARLNEPLSSDHNHPGDTFTATLDRPIVVNGWVVARRGQTILGTVTVAQKAGRVKGVSQLGLELTDITVVDGQQLPVLTELWKGSAGTSHGADAAAITATTATGTIIGAAANGGEGAGIGAGAGALAGVALVLLTRGKPTVLGPEAVLSFQVKDPVNINTANSQHAFLPVGPNDYGSPSPSLRHRDAYGAYPPPYYAACDPYWGCGPSYYPYYGPSFGVVYYGGYHGYYHGGFHR